MFRETVYFHQVHLELHMKNEGEDENDDNENDERGYSVLDDNPRGLAHTFSFYHPVTV